MVLTHGFSSVVTFDQATYEQLATTHRELPVGTLIAKHYEVISVVGTGGMGIVYKTRHQLLNKTMAIKLLLRSEQSTSLIRFQREAQAASRLRHANIVSVHEFGCTDSNQLYMVMDFVEGRTLAEALEERVRLSLDETLDIFIQICDAAAHAHANAVLHRDLKPGNILLTHKAGGVPVVNIVDFGIAKLIDNPGWEIPPSQTGQLCGSPLYMSPEQSSAKATDERSDIYSIGCMLYESLAGKPPIYGGNSIETIFKQVNESPCSLQKACGLKFSAKVEALVARTLAKNPDDRFQSAIELRDALIDLKLNATRTMPAIATPPVATESGRRVLKMAAAIIPLLLFAAISFLFLSGVPLDSRNDSTSNGSPMEIPLHVINAANAAEAANLADSGRLLLHQSGD
ncbi:MAG TPA: serine/threonine-protein kinase [Planktothrix sp.]|jgi:serine/threonine-protein kinase